MSFQATLIILAPFASRRAIFHPTGANIINVGLNPGQYLYNIKQKYW